MDTNKTALYAPALIGQKRGHMKSIENRTANKTACMPSISRKDAMCCRIRAAYARADEHKEHAEKLRADGAEVGYVRAAEKRRAECIKYAHKLERELNILVQDFELARSEAPIVTAIAREEAAAAHDLQKTVEEEARARAAHFTAAAALAENRRAAAIEARENAEVITDYAAAIAAAEVEECEAAHVAEFTAAARRALSFARAAETHKNREAAAREKSAGTSLYIPRENGKNEAAREAEADARLNMFMLKDEADRARRLADVDGMKRRAAEAGKEAELRRREARAAISAAMHAETVDTYREAREAEEAARAAIADIARDKAAAEAREAANKKKSIEEHNTEVEAREAAAAFDQKMIKEQTARAARAAAKSNETYVAREDDEAREAREAAKPQIEAPLAWQVCFYPLDYQAALKGIKRREAGAAVLMSNALDSVLLHAVNVNAKSRVEAIRAALLTMDGGEAGEDRIAENAAIKAAAEAARAAEKKKDDEAAAIAYKNAVAVLNMMLSVKAETLASAVDDPEAAAAQLYNAAKTIVQSSSRRAYNAVKGTSENAEYINVKKGDLTNAARLADCVFSVVGHAENVDTPAKMRNDDAMCNNWYELTATGTDKARARLNGVSASREEVLKEMYNTSVRADAILHTQTLVPDMMHEVVCALLTAQRDGVENAHAASLTGYSAVNKIIDGEGMQGRKTPDISLDVLVNIGEEPRTMTKEEKEAREKDRAAIAQMIKACRPLMTKRQREVMQLSITRKKNGEKLTVAEIAAYIGVKSRGTVAEIQQKARAILAGYIKNHENEFSPAINRAARFLIADDAKRRAAASLKEKRRREAARAHSVK